MMRYLLDTAFLVDHLRRNRAAVQRFAELLSAHDEVLVNEIVVCELWHGTHRPDDPALIALLRPLEFVQPAQDAAKRAGRWRADARARGRTLSLPDALIAAAADSVGATVLTRNARDFALTPVRVETY